MVLVLKHWKSRTPPGIAAGGQCKDNPFTSQGLASGSALLASLVISHRQAQPFRVMTWKDRFETHTGNEPSVREGRKRDRAPQVPRSRWQGISTEDSQGCGCSRRRLRQTRYRGVEQSGSSSGS